MMECTILAVGDIKHEYLKEGAALFEKWLAPYVKLSVVEVAEAKEPKNASAKDIETLKEKEGKVLLEKLPEGKVVALDAKGKAMKSEEFASYLEDIKNYDAGKVCFVIGGSHGLSRDVRKRANMVLSLSKMTFPHQLTRVILLEQLYRAMKILHNEPYHK